MNTLTHITRICRHILLIVTCSIVWVNSVYALPNKVNESHEATAYKGESYYRAKDFMDRVFHYVEQNNLGNVEYNSDVYIRHRMHTKRKGPIVRYLPGMLRLEHGEHDYLSELRLRFQYRMPNELDCKIVAYHSTARYQKATRLIAMRRFNFQIYDSNLFLDCILNPLHYRNKRFYRYRYSSNQGYKDSTATSVRINIQPRFNNDQLVKGYIDLNPKTGAVTHFVFNLRYQMQNLTINGSLGKNGYETLIPIRMRIVSNFKFMGNRINEVYEIYSHHHFNPIYQEDNKKRCKYNITRQCLLRIDTAQIINQIAYFDSIRPLPLRKFETNIIEQHRKTVRPAVPKNLPYTPTHQDSITTNCDSIVKDSTTTKTIQTNDRTTFLNERTKNILLDSHNFNMGNRIRSSFKIPALLTPSRIGWSKSKGFSLKAKAKWYIYLSQRDYLPFIEFSPKIGYNFKQKQVYWDVPMFMRIIPKYDGTFSFRASGGSHMYNNRQAEEVRKKLKGIEKYDSLVMILDQFGFHDYRNTNVDIDFGISPLPGLRFTLGSRYRNHTLLEWNKLADVTGMARNLKSIGPFAQIEWTPGQYYYCKDKRKIPLYSKYPTFILNYERGYGIGKGQTNYERFEFDTRYRLPLYAMRTLFFRFGSGIFTNRGYDCFLSYDFFNFNYMPEDWKDELTGEFQLLDARWYYESRYYLRFTGTYESPMMFLARVPGLTRVIQKERVYLNLLNVNRLGLYTELGYGISTHLLDIGTFMSIANDHSLQFGCKFVLKFFDE